jgi:hypothetical protein
MWTHRGEDANLPPPRRPRSSRRPAQRGERDPGTRVAGRLAPRMATQPAARGAYTGDVPSAWPVNSHGTLAPGTLRVSLSRASDEEEVAARLAHGPQRL